jgi:two-component sensor histidine kinase
VAEDRLSLRSLQRVEVQSLLALQAGTINEPKTVYVLNEASNWIKTMSGVYDCLYRSSDVRFFKTLRYFSTLLGEIAKTWQSEN